ncbi:Glutamyl-tRNA(Gln) amidotransferase subunit A, mitochondrial [Gryllus bimaculatus]|nr:Glutamyl-tRNA(Gln) amidotransferase subunit A, mitochondrial [Gryllus bimaculatus]
MLGSSIRQIGARLRDASVTSSELCEAAVRRAEKIKELNAFVTVTKDVAFDGAQQSNFRFSKGKPIGPLDGVPIAVKDNFCTQGVQTTCASRMLETFNPKYNATVVQNLLDAGAVLLGKCNMDEFAMGSGTVDSFCGPTKNIWRSKFDPSVQKQNASGDGPNSQDWHNWHIAGGSSGGCAVAVASGAVFAALGSDTGGSTRNPAAYCGLVGYKPTYGLLSRHGLIPLVNSMDVPAVLTRTVDDAILVLDTVAGWDAKDSTSITIDERPACIVNDQNIQNICVGIPTEYHSPGLSEEVLEAWNIVADIFEHAGAKVIQVSLPHTPASMLVYSVLNQCEVASNMARYDAIGIWFTILQRVNLVMNFLHLHEERIGEVVRSREFSWKLFLITKGPLKVRRLIVNDFERVWSSGVDVLLTPTTLSDAPQYKDFIRLENQQQCAMQDYCTQPVNLAGCPAISVPIKLSKNGLPISLQLIGKFSNDRMLLSVGRFIEDAVKFPRLNLND